MNLSIAYPVSTLSHLVAISSVPQSTVEMFILSVSLWVQLGAETNQMRLLFEAVVVFFRLPRNQTGMNTLSFLFLIQEAKLWWFKVLSYQGQNTPTRGFKKCLHKMGK